MDAAQIGAEVRSLRKERRLSQEELAKVIGVPRSAVVAIEHGKRKLSAEELIRLAEFFNIPLDHLVHPELRVESVVESSDCKSAVRKKGPRISMPQNRLDVFREVLLYVLGKVGARPNIGQTVLYKLLYFIDFDFYEKYEEQLIGATYIRNHYGPTPTHFKKLVEEMESEGILEVVTSEHFGYPQTKYLPVLEPDLTRLPGGAIELIDSVLDRLGRMNAAQISDYSHHDVPWMIAEEGKPLEYESVFYRTPVYTVRNDSEGDRD